ncbi:hypothetical protein HK102_001104 [Quaeritorhiza haematococci]|nr:hypothetical protein HK102_001104 [Quaeritorhiza haematococci]
MQMWSIIIAAFWLSAATLLAGRASATSIDLGNGQTLVSGDYITLSYGSQFIKSFCCKWDDKTRMLISDNTHTVPGQWSIFQVLVFPDGKITLIDSDGWALRSVWEWRGMHTSALKKLDSQPDDSARFSVEIPSPGHIRLISNDRHYMKYFCCEDNFPNTASSWRHAIVFQNEHVDDFSTFRIRKSDSKPPASVSDILSDFNFNLTNAMPRMERLDLSVLHTYNNLQSQTPSTFTVHQDRSASWTTSFEIGAGIKVSESLSVEVSIPAVAKVSSNLEWEMTASTKLTTTTIHGEQSGWSQQQTCGAGLYCVSIVMAERGKGEIPYTATLTRVFKYLNGDSDVFKIPVSGVLRAENMLRIYAEKKDYTSIEEAAAQGGLRDGTVGGDEQHEEAQVNVQRRQTYRRPRV